MGELSAIRYHHLTAGLPVPPLAGAELVKIIKRTIKREQGEGQVKIPVLVNMLDACQHDDVGRDQRGLLLS